MKGNMVYLQSGGPTAVINTSLLGAVLEAKAHPEQIGAIYGSLHGIEGLLNDDLIDLGAQKMEQLELLHQTPGAILGTSRHRLPADIHDPEYATILATLCRHRIRYLFVNGGNDSMDTCSKLARLAEEKGLDLRVIGIPKTIDNDLAITDFSLGFPSAAKAVINEVQSLYIDAASFGEGKVYVAEIMGRQAGWLAASASLIPAPYTPDLILLPEAELSLAGVLDRIEEVYAKKHVCMVVVSEGVLLDRDLSHAKVDAFGHPELEGVSRYLLSHIKARGYPCRDVVYSIPHRCEPSYLSLFDLTMAEGAGRFAVASAMQGHSGKMVAIERKRGECAFFLAEVSQIANVDKNIPAEWINGDYTLSAQYRDYLRPLIAGEPALRFENGILRHATLEAKKPLPAEEGAGQER